MTNKVENTQNQNLLLSFSVFKKLYDEKKDIYEIIVLFIKQELSNTKINEFLLAEITQKINKGYNFDIPQAIVKISLNRLKKIGNLKLDNGKYIKLKKFEYINIIADDANLAKKEEKYVVNIFKDSIEHSLSDNDIRKSLEAYILNKNDIHNIFPVINACIIKNSSDDRFIEGLNEIKQGLIIYDGISYGIDSINPKNWNEKIIFLDTEILFYLGSYSGDLFKKITNDFISLIIIANKEKKVIKLKFSKDVKDQIDSFFYSAESIIEKKKVYEPNDVIKNILSKCSSASDIVNEKGDFYLLLSKLGITEYEDKDYYDAKNHQYNLEHESDLQEKIQQHLKQLSVINILRNGKTYKTLDKVKYLLLTETRNTINLSIKHKDKNDFPLALSLFDLTNQLWIKTNKGLGNSELPSTFDIRNKAKIALSSSFAKKVLEEFDKVYNNYKNENIDKNSFIDKISDLRKISSNPDDINESNSEEIKDLIIDPNSMERHYAEKTLYKQKVEDKNNIIKNQTYKLKEKDDKISKLEKLEKERKFRNKRILKGLVYLVIIFLLFYFSDYIVLFIGNFIFYVIGGLASIFGVCDFFGIDKSKIKSWLKKLKI